MLDGWLIIQKRKRENELNKKMGDEKIGNNPKIRNSSEIFVVVDNFEDAKKIDAMNDLTGKILKRQKMETVKKLGVVHEGNMPDVQQEIMMEFNKLRGKRRG